MLSISFLYKKGWNYLCENGFLRTTKKIFVFAKWSHKLHYIRKQWVTTEETIKKQRETLLVDAPFISIIVPLFNTPERYLHEMLVSVCKQSYTNWQLCLADGSDCVNNIQQIILQYESQYPGKIKYRLLKKNYGISENTNACIALADGEYLALLDHDDVLALDALFEVARVIVEKKADFVYTDEMTFVDKLENIRSVHFKPDFAKDNLIANNYICHFTVFKKTLLDKVGLFRQEYDGSQDHDMMLRLTAVAELIEHIPKILYYWRSHKNSVAADINSKSYAIEAGKKAVSDHLQRQGLKAKVESSKVFPAIYRIKYELTEQPLISIIIPMRGKLDNLKRCVESILEKSTYPNYEIVIIHCNSANEGVIPFYHKNEKHPNIQTIKWSGPFNFALVNNWGVQHAKGQYLIMLNSNTKVISPNWIEEMLMYAQRSDVGAVGAKLYYPNDTIRHCGMILGLGKAGVADIAHYKFIRNDKGYMGRPHYAQDMSAVTASCMMVKKSLYDELGGLNEKFTVAFNDVDFCLRLRSAGYLIVFTPYAELYQYDSKLRNIEDTMQKKEWLQKDVELFKECWAKELAAGDPYYNPNLTLDRGDFSLR